jgi:hypothetical protein
MDQAPHIRIEHAPHFFDGHVLELAIDRHASVVDPGIEAAELVFRFLRDLAHVILFADVGDHVNCFAALARNFIGQLVQRISAARREHKPRASFGCHSRSGQTDSG